MKEADCELIAQFYRGLVQTASVWRQRLDVTETWSVPLLVALFTIAFNSAAFPPIALLLVGILLLASAALIEARRYREVLHALWRTRLVEGGCFASVLSNTEADPQWRTVLADDLERPRLRVSIATAFLARVRRTYLLLLYLLVAAWISKLVIHPRMATSAGELVARAGGSYVAGLCVVGSVVVLVVVVTVLAVRTPSHSRLEGSLVTQPASLR